jgi:hypothetical protein
MGYSITTGTKVFKREKYEVLNFESFEELVNNLQGSRAKLLANQSTKFNSEWISSEICNINTNFKQENFSHNGGTIILDFDGTLSLKNALELLKGYNYYIYNSTNNGNEGAEKFRIILPLNRALGDANEIKNFYQSMNQFFDGTADAVALTSCWLMYKPQHWQSTTKGVKANHSVIEINEYRFDAKNINIDEIFTKFPIVVITYGESKTEDFDKIDSIKQSYFISKVKNDFLALASNRYKGFYNLGLQLKSFGLRNADIASHLEDVKFNRKKNTSITDTMKSIEAKSVSINPCVFKDEYYRELVLDRKMDTFRESPNHITLKAEEKLSSVTEMMTSDAFSEDGVNLLDSPTNSGKTYYVINEYKKYIDSDEMVILFVPYLTLLNELKSTYETYAISGNDEFDIDEAKKSKVVVATYNKLYTLLNSDLNFNNCHIFIDEAHNLYSSYSYRFEILMDMYNKLINHGMYKKLILMSGTFDKGYFKKGFINKHITIRRESAQVKKECTVIETTSSVVGSAVNKVIEFFNEDKSRLQIIYMNNKNVSKDISDLLKNNDIHTLLLNSDTKDDDIIKRIYETNNIPSDINVLIMTKIGEEGISFYNQIFAIHTIGKVDGSTAEQLGNRPRKHPTSLFIHTKKKEATDKQEYVFNEGYVSLEEKYNTTVKEIQKAVKGNELTYKQKKYEYCRRFVHWDEYTKEVTLSNLAIVSDLYEMDKINELNYYNYYFKEKMEYYGWNITFIKDIPEDALRVEFTKKSNQEKLDIINTLIHYFKRFINSTKIQSPTEDDFVKFMTKMNVDTYDKSLIMNVFNDYGFLSTVYDDKYIFEALSENNRTNKSFKRLFDLKLQENDKPRMTNWLYKNVVIGKEYNKEMLIKLAQEYLSEETKYSPKKSKPISAQKMNQILADAFIIEKLNKKINKKSEQVTLVKSKISYRPKVEVDIGTTIDDLNEYSRYIDMLSLQENPTEHTSEEEFNDILNEEINLKYLISDIHPNVTTICKLEKWL